MKSNKKVTRNGSGNGNGALAAPQPRWDEIRQCAKDVNILFMERERRIKPADEPQETVDDLRAEEAMRRRARDMANDELGQRLVLASGRLIGLVGVWLRRDAIAAELVQKPEVMRAVRRAMLARWPLSNILVWACGTGGWFDDAAVLLSWKLTSELMLSIVRRDGLRERQNREKVGRFVQDTRQVRCIGAELDLVNLVKNELTAALRLQQGGKVHQLAKPAYYHVKPRRLNTVVNL